VALTALLASAGSAWAVPINTGFETGDLSGWTATPGFVSAVPGPDAVNFGSSIVVTSPIEGSYMARLLAGVGTDLYTVISQDFSLAAGETLSGWARFVTPDYVWQPALNRFNDDAYVSIGGATVFSSSVFALGNPIGSVAATAWTSWVFVAPFYGVFTLEAGVRNVGDNSVPSKLYLDGVYAVPEPGTLGLIGVGLLGLGFRARRRNT
jgi:hypothetical protein